VTGRAKPSAPPPYPGGGGRVASGRPPFPGDRPRLWGQVPPRNPHFTGRGGELAALAAALADGSTVTVHAVRGMGGVGKTQLATQFARDHASDYDLVYWLAAEEPAALPDQFTKLAVLLGLEPAADPEGLQAQVHQRLRDVDGWLLIFDNADDAGAVEPWIPAVPLPPGVRGHALVTTRRSGFDALGEVLDLDVVSPDEALELLRTRVPGLTGETGAELAEELGFLPLALEQAAAYIRRSDLPPGQYLRQLRQRAQKMYQRGKVAGRDVTIATLWDISLERVRAENPAALQLLDLCAYLAPDRIPPDLFTAHPDHLPEPLAAVAADELAFDEAVAVLADYSLASRTETGLQVHRLLQGALRARHQQPPPRPSS
jgi:NB-ARC domain-containing protein